MFLCVRVFYVRPNNGLRVSYMYFRLCQSYHCKIHCLVTEVGGNVGSGGDCLFDFALAAADRVGSTWRNLNAELSAFA